MAVNGAGMGFSQKVKSKNPSDGDGLQNGMVC
jgi:hypothetical protein